MVGGDPDVDPLTPQILLNLGRSMPLVISQDIPPRMGIVNRWSQIQAVASEFWRRWCREYRSSLQGRCKWNKVLRCVKVGDIELVIDEAEARCHWPLSRVLKVKRSQDGLVRSVDLLARGKRYTRPIAKLIMLVENEELP